MGVVSQGTSYNDMHNLTHKFSPYTKKMNVIKYVLKGSS
jgi:hypothetical protein